MEPNNHIGELAELYAAGVLDERDRSIVEGHVAGCDECLRRTGEAEETVLALERRFKTSDDVAAIGRSLSLTQPVKPFWTIGAIAAALIVGFLLPHPVRQQGPATLAMIQSHFAHAQFIGSGAHAKVLYARDRSWYYVVVEGSHHYDVYGLRAGKAEFIGSTEPVGLTSDLFSRPSQRFDAMELRDSGRALERAAIR